MRPAGFAGIRLPKRAPIAQLPPSSNAPVVLPRYARRHEREGGISTASRRRRAASRTDPAQATKTGSIELNGEHARQPAAEGTALLQARGRVSATALADACGVSSGSPRLPSQKCRGRRTSAPWRERYRRDARAGSARRPLEMGSHGPKGGLLKHHEDQLDAAPCGFIASYCRAPE